MRILPLAEAKSRLSQLVTDVAEHDEAITITRNGRAAAVLVSHEEFERWKETVDILTNAELMAEVRKGIADLKRGRGRTLGKSELDRLFAEPPRSRGKRTAR